jgi:molybdopterin-guanine dinucleotide biosynthesis protein A
LPWTADKGGSGERLTAFLDYIDRWLPLAWSARPLRCGLLMGGGSSRMGRAKQLLSFAGRSLGEIAAAALAGSSEPLCRALAVLGSGELPAGPEPQQTATRLPDAPGFAGPGAGMIAAHRWAPEAAWIVAACDHPWLRGEHIEWLAGQRQPGRWAVVPEQLDGHACPTLALYEPQALESLERLAMANARRNADPSALLALPRIAVLKPPAELADGWINVNTPEQLRAEEQRLESRGQNRPRRE